MSVIMPAVEAGQVWAWLGTKGAPGPMNAEFKILTVMKGDEAEYEYTSTAGWLSGQRRTNAVSVVRENARLVTPVETPDPDFDELEIQTGDLRIGDTITALGHFAHQVTVKRAKAVEPEFVPAAGNVVRATVTYENDDDETYHNVLMAYIDMSSDVHMWAELENVTGHGVWHTAEHISDVRLLSLVDTANISADELADHNGIGRKKVRSLLADLGLGER